MTDYNLGTRMSTQLNGVMYRLWDRLWNDITKTGLQCQMRSQLCNRMMIQLDQIDLVGMPE